jgi:hypothetical protein
MNTYNQKLAQEEKQRQALAERKKVEMAKKGQALIDRWYSEEKPLVSLRAPHIRFNQCYVPIFDWTTQYDIPPAVVYLVLCFGERYDMIDICFDKERIPFSWLRQEEPSVRIMCDGLLPTVHMKDALFQSYFWKIIYSHWPRHILLYHPPISLPSVTLSDLGDKAMAESPSADISIYEFKFGVRIK